jgi:hypothetical protein
MKSYRVFVDITISKAIIVDAESEQEAERLATEKVNAEPYYYAGKADGYVSCEVDDVYEEED